MRLKDQIAIVTGASSGLARASAIRFAQEGAKVVMGDVKVEGGREAERVIQESGGEGTFLQTDVAQAEQVERLVRSARDRYGRVDILLNGAGVLRWGYVQDIPEEEWDLLIDVNLKGTFLCCREVVPLMIEQQSGVIVNVSSSGARSFPQIYPGYVAAKSGVLGLTRSMAKALREHHVAVLTICPGYVSTPMGIQAFRELNGRDPDEDEIARLMMTPEQLAGVILNMVDPEMRFASGTIVDAQLL